MGFDPTKIAKQLRFLNTHPEYDEMPTSIEEFLGPEYLNFPTARPGLVAAFKDIFGEEFNPDRISVYERAMVTGGIGIGKTTFASIAIPYMLYVTLCLKDPQDFYGLAAGSRIAFMQMSTSRRQAEDVIFGDLKARIDHSPWFINNYPYDPAYSKVMKFAKDIWVLPGSSDETAYEGYNILGGILEEMDSHKVTEREDYADTGYNTIHSRIASRFVDFRDPERMGHRGLLICIGQMKKSNGFAMRKYNDFLKDEHAFVMRMSIWESFGWDKFTRKDGTRASFFYDSRKKTIVPSMLAGLVDNTHMIEVPLAYKTDFDNAPEKALRDLAGIPPTAGNSFMSLLDRIDECTNRWEEHHGNSPSPVRPNPQEVEFEPWFRSNSHPARRCAHIDYAKGKPDGDALGFAMGHISELIEYRGEIKPYITIDCLIRLKARPGMEILFEDVRAICYTLRDDLGFRLKSVTLDGYQSLENMQQLVKHKFDTEVVSVDKSMTPYEDLRDAIYEHRIEWPRYLTPLRVGDTDHIVDIMLSEVSQLIFDGKKVDHPPDGSKDVSDAVAAVVHRLMGDRVYRRGLRSAGTEGDDSLAQLKPTGTEAGNVLQFPVRPGDSGLQAPVPPVTGGNPFGLTLPPRLKPRG